MNPIQLFLSFCLLVLYSEIWLTTVIAFPHNRRSQDRRRVKNMPGIHKIVALSAQQRTAVVWRKVTPPQKHVVVPIRPVLQTGYGSILPSDTLIKLARLVNHYRRMRGLPGVCVTR